MQVFIDYLIYSTYTIKQLVIFIVNGGIMKNLIFLSILIGAISFLLGIISQLIGSMIIISAAAWNELAQTFLLFALSFGVWEYFKTKK